MAYEKKIPVDLDCPLRLTMSLIESKCKSCILDELRSGEPMRPAKFTNICLRLLRESSIFN